ncbi:fibronectin type III domain-containing protein, partial [Robiginitalea sp.]|nr:fibronectin type III domain-containing protein [Robiginitalea sp.]
IYNTTANTLEYKIASGWVSLISNPDGVNAGEMQYWDGSAWVVIPSSTNDGAILTVVDGIPTWVDGTATAPSELIISNAVGGDTEATVTFTAPASIGGTAIAGYTVTSSPGGITATGVSSPITIQGLTNGTAYTFTVTATSTASSASNPVTFVRAPDAPTIGTATGGDTQATVTFTAPANNGGAAITGYTVTSFPGGITKTGASSSITITGLTNGTPYTFTVTATNSVGTAASAASNSVTPATVPSVTNLTTGKIWMDRNLGATQVAASSTDAASYGDLYQWGRGADGHQLRSSGTTTVQSSSTSPGNTFITVSDNWYTGTDPDNLWQGVNGINNPCPSGYRLPTNAEWDAERATWGSNDAAGALASPLKLPLAGNRYSSYGSLYNVGTIGFYWSSTVSSAYSRNLYLDSSNAYIFTNYRAYGFAVRCLKD